MLNSPGFMKKKKNSIMSVCCFFDKFSILLIY